MLLIDLSILINAHRKKQPRHNEFLSWLEDEISSERMFSIPSVVRSGFIRIVTNPRAFFDPIDTGTALEIMADLMDRPNHVEMNPGQRHWPIFDDLCRKTGARGNLVTDAYLAALAIENGAEIITSDRDFAKFPGLKWRHPLDAPYGGGPGDGILPARESPRHYRVKKGPPRKKK